MKQKNMVRIASVVFISVLTLSSIAIVAGSFAQMLARENVSFMTSEAPLGEADTAVDVAPLQEADTAIDVARLREADTAVDAAPLREADTAVEGS
jgi:hypothetical protein